MRTRTLARVTAAAWGASIVLAAPGTAASQNVTEAQLRLLLPDEPCITAAWMQVRPAIMEIDWPGAPARDIPLTDKVRLNQDMAVVTQGRKTGTRSSLQRDLYLRPDGLWVIHVTAEVYNDAAAAAAEVRSLYGSGLPRPGTPRSDTPLGEQSWTFLNQGDTPLLDCQVGRLVLRVAGLDTAAPRRQRRAEPFPPDAVEALAHMMLLRAARQPELTGASSQTVRLVVNGTAVSAPALQVGKVVYVPVLPVAQAGSWGARWDAKAGTLTLAKVAHPSVALRALSASVNGGPPTLKVPLLSDGGQPVMGLDELLQLTGGSAAREGDVVRLTL